MEFPAARAKSVKADIAKEEITLTFKVPLNDELLALSQELAPYTDKDAGQLVLQITPLQPPLLK